MIGRNKFGLQSLTFELLATTLIGLALLGPAAAQGLAPGLPDIAQGESSLAAEDPAICERSALLLNSPDRKQLASDLEAAIRQGNVKEAENSLNTAIELGTLAIVLVDHLKDPNFLTDLQALGIRGDPSPTPERSTSVQGTAPEACTAPPAPLPVNLADMQQALEQERSFSGMVSQTLTELMQEHNALVARLETETESDAAQAAEIRQALKQEQERREAAQRDLERLQQDNHALQIAREQDKALSTSNASELEARLRQEQERSDDAARQLAEAPKEVQSLQTSKAEAAASASVKIAGLEKALASAQTRSDFLTEELADASEELGMLREPRQPGPTPVIFRLAASGAEPPMAPAQQSASLPEPPALPATLAISSASTAGPASPNAVSAPARESALVVVAALPDAIQPLPLTSTTMDRPKAEPPAAADSKAGLPASPLKPDERLMSRAEELLRKGDVSGARLLLERALASGNARAVFLLAETFDPNVLSKLGVFGIRGDAAKAREFYTRARELGIAQAGERMEALK